MAPLRALLGSRAVIAGLVAFGCLGLFVSTLDNSRRLDLSWNRPEANVNQNNNCLAGLGKSNIDWDDGSGKSKEATRPLSVYPGRRPLTHQGMLEKAQVYYDRIVKQRHQTLNENGYGTSSFDPWFVLMYYWWYFPASFQCPLEIQRVGPISDGGKWICGMSLYEEKPRAKCVIYSFGINHETRFEEEMLDRTDCVIYAYDASVNDMGQALQGRKNVYFKPYFVGAKDEVKDGKTWRTLRTLMKENGHDWIDILKVDIEGSEYPTFNAIMDDFHDVLPFSQLQMELHVRQDMVSFPDFLKWWERLESKGIFPWWTEINLNPTWSGDRAWASEYCFINVRGGSKNLLIQNYE